MKKLLLFTATLLVFSMSSFAQNNIQLNINHKLGATDFAMETGAKNNLENDFEVTRLQYYISEITVTHDGGMETLFEEVWVLVNASEATLVDLGDHNITSIEMVKLHIGVDEAHNHLDPASFPATHPLAPTFPSMHWGWAAGYRFVAIEGNSGNNMSQLFQLHGLGDINYFAAEIPLSTEATNNEILIDLDADYTRALENINLTAGVIVHGDYGDAKKCLENFKDFVFSPTSATTATINFDEVNQFDVFPNPSLDGNATIVLNTTENLNYAVSITDILGKQVMYFNAVNSNATIDLQLEEKGFYFINLIKEGQAVITKKLVSK